MKISLCENIRALRREKGVTQEEMASVLGVTAQAVSRWESLGGYPDMELIPTIAGYLGVTVDRLFGVEGDRERRIDEILRRSEEFEIEYQTDDSKCDKCIALLREGLAEFPKDERLTHRLAGVLSATGWMRHREWLDYGEDGHIRHCFDRHRENEYWNEAMKLYESLIGSRNSGIRTDSIFGLLILKRNIGEYDRACELAWLLPTIRYSREIMLASATDGVPQAGYLGEALLELAYEFAEQLIYALINDISFFGSDMPTEKVKGTLYLFDLIGDGENLGVYEREISYIYLYLSRLQWERGYHDEAFGSLYLSLDHARMFDDFAALSPENRRYKSRLLRHTVCRSDIYLDDGGRLAPDLPDIWPMWCNPDYEDVKKQITADPRWDEWALAARSQA